MQHPLDSIRTHLARTYGGKKAFVAAIFHAFRFYSGALNDYAQIDWRRVSRVIFVCKGNICRSPFAEHRFHALGAKVQSAGLEADPGKPANEQAAKVAARHGVDLTPHRSSHVSQLELTETDLLVAFEPAHADALRKLSTPQTPFQVTLLGLWSPAARMPYLHDPYGLPEAYFETCFGRIDQGLKGIWAKWSGARKSMRDAP